MNLVVNARDAMPSGGRVTIETANVELDESFRQDAAVVAGSCVMLAVSDSGVGMDEGTKSRLFEAVLHDEGSGQGDRARARDGLGHREAERRLHLGVQRAGSRRDLQGLPAMHRTGRRERDAGRRRRGHRPATETVLVVEDEDAVRLLTRRILERAGYRVFDAPNPEQAELMFERNKDLFDLLVTDVVMPGSSGPRMFERLVQQRPDLKVLYVSGYTDDTIVHQGKLNPGIALLQKPFTADALKRRVREVLDR